MYSCIVFLVCPMFIGHVHFSIVVIYGSPRESKTSVKPYFLFILTSKLDKSKISH